MNFKRLIDERVMLDDYLANQHFSKKDIHLLKMEERITVNDAVIKTNTYLFPNDYLEIDIHKEEVDTIKPVQGNIKILYEDDILLIVDKPTGIIIHNDNSSGVTMDNLVEGYYQRTNQNHPILHVHRLDKETSGCIMYVKERYMAAIFDYMLANKEIVRKYHALVEGRLPKPITVDQKIGANRHLSNTFMVSDSGKKAVTHITPLKHYNGNTLVECVLETGRTHQIRVHCAYLRHPIVGDEIYGGKPAERMMLNSYSISFYHPLKQKTIEIQAKDKFEK